MAISHKKSLGQNFLQDNLFLEIGDYDLNPESILIKREEEAGSLLPASIVFFPIKKQKKATYKNIAA